MYNCSDKLLSQLFESFLLGSSNISFIKFNVFYDY